MDITGKDRVHVAKEVQDEDQADFTDDGTHYVELEVFNHVSLERRFYINSVNGEEEFEPNISAGDAPDMGAPDYITERLADWLWTQHSIEVEQLDANIQVIDTDSEDVHRI